MNASPAAQSAPRPPLRAIIASPGIGLVQRGFERLFRDLYEALRHEPGISVTLWKGGGPRAEGERTPFFLPRNGRFLRHVPLHLLLGRKRTRMHVECLTYALAMLPALRRGEADLVHVIDPPLCRLLFHLRRRSRLNFKLLYTEGTAMPPGDYPPADHVTQMSPVTLREALDHGHSPASQSLLPCGIDADRFVCREDRASLRRRHGVTDDTFVILSVAALNRYHKRTHHLIDEVARLPGRVLLWLDGSMDHGDPDLPDLARRVLGDRVRITRVPSDQVGELYALADVKVLASTHEAFGLVVPEALSAGAAVLVHDSPHFRWLAGAEDNLVDMAAPGALAARLAALRADPAALARLRRPAETRARLDWSALRADYLAVYRDLVAGRPVSTSVAARPDGEDAGRAVPILTTSNLT